MARGEETAETIQVIYEKPGSFSGFWEENKENKIFSGKKNTATSLKEIPQLQTNNYRQATSQTPGLLISEVPNESLAAITYRGLGNPHESFNVLLLQDGIPVSADMYGYPAHYYSPALPMMDQVQFIRGGASLLYGPQPGGVLNYASTPLNKNQKASGKFGLTGGSYELVSTNNAFYGSKGNNSYAIEYFRRQGQGPQRVNSDFTADYLQMRNHHFAGKNKYKISFNGYDSDHGESGGFAKYPGANRNVFGNDLGKASKKYDRLKVSRAQLALGVESKIDDSSEIQVNVWATAYRRYSKRQTGSGFGTFATGSANTIVNQNFYGYNAEARYLKNYQMGPHQNTFTAGVLNYNILSPVTQEAGAGPDSNSGAVTRRLERETHTNSFFFENRFTFGKLMVTPGVRVESIQQTIDERKNVTTTAKRQENETENVPLLGIGIAYHLTDDSQIYANISEAYKPVTFNESVPTGDNISTISEDIDASKIINYELGYRGNTNRLNWDASAFFIRYENAFGQVGTNFENTGAGEHKGLDLASEVKLSEIFTTLKPRGNFNFYANLAYLEARFTRGSLEDKTPQYAPKTITRVGIIHSREDKYKVALMGVMVDRHFGDDGNTDNFKISSYTVLDLTGDYNLNKSWIVSAGINNLLDKEYYSRVRADGINWALGRNYYAGATYKF
jgi:Fe(3+) dicitrate transport protein